MTSAAEQHDLEKRLASANRMLTEFNQQHLLTFAGELEEGELAHLLDQIDHLDVPAAVGLIRGAQGATFESPPGDAIAPATFIPRTPSDADSMREIGYSLLREGKVAAFTVAGGQGTRLGWNGPKGTYPATPLTGKPLFRVFAEQLAALGQRTGRSIPWYIMTSPINDTDTRAFFRDNNWFGLNRTDVFLFPQGVLPSFDESGKFLLSSRSEIAVNPDGHGGALRALRTSGAIEDMRERGIEQISYFQIDNPTVHVIDPLFIGLHAANTDSSGEMSSKMVPKCDPAEKVGVFCSVDGHTCVIEYSDLPEELAGSVDESGELRFLAGSIAIHALSVEFVDRITAPESTTALPLHHAQKKVPHIDIESGERVEPTEPNATKLEMFIFDAIPLAGRSIVYETDRVEEFAPIKNAEGVDSAISSHGLQLERSARWLESAGVEIPRGEDGVPLASIEITSRTALGADDLREMKLPTRYDPGEQVVL